MLFVIVAVGDCDGLEMLDHCYITQFVRLHVIGSVGLFHYLFIYASVYLHRSMCSSFPEMMLYFWAIVVMPEFLR